MTARRAVVMSLLLAAFAVILPLAQAALVERPLNPANTAWYVTDEFYNPVDDAWLTIYYSTSPNGPFTIVPADTVHTYVVDEIAQPNIRRNPVITGYWNGDHPAGYAVANVHVTAISNYYFYVKVDFDADGDADQYWPTAESIKPGDPTWAPVLAPGALGGYAASGSGMGNGVTTAYPTVPPPRQVIPEVPLGAAIATATMIVGMIGYVGLRRRKPKLQY